MRACQAIAVGVLAVASVASQAATIHVDCSGQGDYLTIQEGVDAATYGDTVLVAPGTYTGELNRNIDFDGRIISLLADAGRDATVIDCQSEGRAFVFSSAESYAAKVEGFTIRNGYAYEGGAVYMTNSSASFISCAFEDGHSSYGGAFFLGQEACPYIYLCTFDDNYAAEYGGAIYTYAARPNVEECEFTNNEAAISGGAISCKTWTVAEVKNSLFVGNSADDGGGG